MKTIRNISVLIFLLAVVPSECFSMVKLVEISPERAEQMGVTIRPAPGGDVGVGVSLEFRAKGQLQNFTHVKLQISDGPKRLEAAPLQTSRPTADIVSFYFAADPTWLATSVLTVVVKRGELDLVGYQFKVKDFIKGEKAQ